jgi:hypothetical protein
MVEVLAIDRGGFPIDRRMTPGTIVPESALMVVFVASTTCRRKPEPRVSKILSGKKRALRRGDVLRGMARAAAHTGVFAFERIACLGVIETRGCRIPMDHVEVHAIMVRMAFDACGSSRARTRKGRMEAFVLLQFHGYFTVALETAKCRSLGRNFMALRAIGIPIQALMGLR